MRRTYLGYAGCVAIAVVGFLISTRLVAEQQKAHGALRIENPADLKWSPVASLPYGAEVAVLDGDMTKKTEFTVRLRLPANYKVPPHFHPADEHVTVMDGSFYMGMGDSFDESAAKEMKTGGFHSIPTGTHHYAFTKGAAIIQLHGNGPWGITYINPNDDPRKTATK